MSDSMTISDWKRLAKLALTNYPSGPMWDEALDALLRASENEGLPVLDKAVEELS